MVLISDWGPSASASSSPDARILQAVQADNPPTLDGILDDAVWEGVPRTEPFRQKEPTEGNDASETTYVQVIYTEESLFFGITCLDSSPAGIVASELRRDGDLSKDDSFWVLIDSFHDHRNAFLFATNPQGTQYDALVLDEGKETNSNWDEAWNVAANRNAEGWSLEVEIPFKILRMKDSDAEIGLESNERFPFDLTGGCPGGRWPTCQGDRACQTETDGNAATSGFESSQVLAWHRALPPRW